MNFLRNKLSVDILWTIGSFAILALSGILINIAVVYFRDFASLGNFNQSYAVYLVASQISVLGIHYSVLRHGAHHSSLAEQEVRNTLVSSALLMVIALGILGAAVLYWSAPYVGKMLDSVATSKSLVYAAGGIIFFPANKVLISYINGMRHMRAFSLIQSMRYILVMGWIIVISASSLDFSLAGGAFLFAETITFIVCLIYVRVSGLYQFSTTSREWYKRHLSFGVRSLFAGLFAELNSRLDVLIVGYFLPDTQAGIYSFVAMIVDGLLHLIVMIRININPILVAAYRDNSWDQPRELLSKSMKFMVPLTIVISGLALLGLWIADVYIIPSKDISAGMMSLAILLVGLTCVSWLVPFDNLMLTTGHPAWQAFQQIVVVVTNLAFGFLLVPLLGIEGAAIASALASIAGVLTLVILAMKFIHWNLLTNKMTG